MKTRLFIEDEEIELNENVSFAITRSFEDITDPTKINNDWSKTINIPGTLHNNKIFAHFYKPDQVIVGGPSFVGLYFDPTKKLKFKLLYGDSLLMDGYAKMTDVVYNDQKATYHITLNGELGRIFQELKKITFSSEAADPSSPNHEYYIDGNDYFTCPISKEKMRDFFNYTGQADPPVTEKTIDQCDEFDIIGFTPNNAFVNGFNYKTFQINDGGSKSFIDVLKDTEWFPALNINPDSIYPNGVSPREIGEFRVNHQIPFIYVKRLWQIFEQKALSLDALSGYTFNIEPLTWTQNVRYWNQFVMLLNPMIKSTAEKRLTNIYRLYPTTPTIYRGNPSNVTTHLYAQNPYEEKSSYVSSNQYFTLSAGDFEYVGGQKMTFNIYCKKSTNLTHGGVMQLCPVNGFVVRTFMIDQNGSEISGTSYKTAVLPQHYTGGATPTVDNTIHLGDFEDDPNTADQLYASFEIPLSFDFRHGQTTRFRIGYEVKWLSLVAYPLIEVAGGYSYNVMPAENWGIIFDPQYTMSILENSKRTGGVFTLNDLWDNNVSPFDCLIQYFKMFHMYIYVDSVNKSINIVRSTDYFSRKSTTYKDWTDKLNTSKDMTITPIYWNKKYIDLSYEDSKTKIGEEFATEFGHQWGGKRIITDYNFNEDSENLFPKHKQPLTSSNSILSWEMIYTKHLLQYVTPSEEYVNNVDEDNKEVDTFGTFYLRFGKVSFDTNQSLSLRQVYISDDTAMQKAQNSYFYAQLSDDMVAVSNYQRIGLRYKTDASTFGIPERLYLHPSLANFSWVPQSSSAVFPNYVRPIYDNFWKKWIEERYNVQTKLVKCYLNITPLDYFNFEFNDFIKIGNQLYVINKIYDYDITSNEPTKVDLITVRNISNYTTDNYVSINVAHKQFAVPVDTPCENEVFSNYRWTAMGQGFDFVLDGVTHHNEVTGNGRKKLTMIPKNAGQQTVSIEMNDMGGEESIDIQFDVENS